MRTSKLLRVSLRTGTAWELNPGLVEFGAGISAASRDASGSVDPAGNTLVGTPPAPTPIGTPHNPEGLASVVGTTCVCLALKISPTKVWLPLQSRATAPVGLPVFGSIAIAGVLVSSSEKSPFTML